MIPFLLMIPRSKLLHSDGQPARFVDGKTVQCQDSGKEVVFRQNFDKKTAILLRYLYRSTALIRKAVGDVPDKKT